MNMYELILQRRKVVSDRIRALQAEVSVLENELVFVEKCIGELPPSPEEYGKPWVTAGVSRATWFRRLKAIEGGK